MTGNGQTVAIESDRAIVRNGSIETDLKSPAINSTLSDLSNAVIPAGMRASASIRPWGPDFGYPCRNDEHYRESDKAELITRKLWFRANRCSAKSAVKLVR
ncbi:hypothetical protein [Methylomonas sp. CM2]|uniref:hypothetical protein n=1 Tax=Methylomonas sp. CM2 TaxID=3417647 RepID=UPI003CEEDA87